MVAAAEFVFRFEEGSTSHVGGATAAGSSFNTTRAASAASSGGGSAAGGTSYSGNHAAAIARQFGKDASGAIDAATGTSAGSQGLSAIGRAATIAGSDLLVLGAAAAGAGALLYAAAKGIEAVRDAANRASKDLVGYSGALAYATAQQQAMGILQNVNRGSQLGGSLGRYVTAQGEYQRAAQRFLDTFIPIFIEVAVPILQKLTGISDGLTNVVHSGEKAIVELPFEIAKAYFSYIDRDPDKKKFIEKMEAMADIAIDSRHRQHNPDQNQLITDFLKLGPPLPDPVPHRRAPARGGR